MCVGELCVMSKLCVRRRRREAGGADGSARPKTRTPHTDVGNNSWKVCE